MGPVEQRAILCSVRQISLRAVHRVVPWFQVLEALEYVHRQGIVHGQLHARHIIWCARDRAWKLIDFAQASPIGAATFPSKTGTRKPPEIALALKQRSERINGSPSTDMWSFGLVAFEVLTCTSNIPPVI